MLVEEYVQFFKDHPEEPLRALHAMKRVVREYVEYSTTNGGRIQAQAILNQIEKTHDIMKIMSKDFLDIRRESGVTKDAEDIFPNKD